MKHSYLVSLLFAAPFLLLINFLNYFLRHILYNHPLLSSFINVNPQDIAQVISVGRVDLSLR